MNGIILMEREIERLTGLLLLHGYCVDELFKVMRGDDEKKCNCGPGKECGRIVEKLKREMKLTRDKIRDLKLLHR